MSTRLLITGGRAPAALELARLLGTAGHQVYAAESLDNSLVAASRHVRKSFRVPAPVDDPQGFTRAITRIIEDHGIDLVLPTCEEVFHLASHPLPCPVFAPPFERLLRLHSKWEFIQDLNARGIQTPDTWLVRSPQETADVLKSLPPTQRLVFKPVYSRFGVAVHVQKASDPPPALDGRPWVVQAFVEGRAWCTYSIVRNGRLRAHAAYQPRFTAGPGASVYFQAEDHSGLRQWVEAFAGEGLTGQLAFDFIEAPDGTLYPLECNPRATSGVHLFGPDGPLADALLQDDGPVLTPTPGASAMLGLAMGVYALPSALLDGQAESWLTAFTGARDVVASWTDPGPALAQVALYAELLWKAQRLGVTALEASTADIAWNAP